MAKYVLEQKRHAPAEVATTEAREMRQKAAMELEKERERMRWELRQGYGGQLSHWFMVRPESEV